MHAINITFETIIRLDYRLSTVFCLILECDFICHKKCEGRVFMKCTSKLESDALLQQDRTKESFEESAEILTEKVHDAYIHTQRHF